MQFGKLILVHLLMVLTVFCSSAHSNENCTIRVGWEDWFPYIYMRNGQLEGPEYSLIRDLALKVGCAVKFVEEPWIRSLSESELSFEIQADLLVYRSEKYPCNDSFGRD